MSVTKSEFFSDNKTLATEKDRISAKIGFKIAWDQLTLWSFTVKLLIETWDFKLRFTKVISEVLFQKSLGSFK